MIDRLIGIANREDILLRSRQHARELDLCMIRVLKFINQQETGVATFASKQERIASQQLNRTGDQRAESQQTIRR